MADGPDWLYQGIAGAGLAGGNLGGRATYLNRPSYGGIRAALKAGSGYDSVPDHWGASQGKPQT